MMIIEQLKKNEKAFCLLSPEEQDFILGCKADDLEYLSGLSKRKKPEWLINGNTPDEIERCPIDTYRLRSDYKDEPEIVEREIIVGACGALVYTEDCVPNDIEMAYHDPDFIGVKSNGWIWGCLYRKKTDGTLYTFIDAESIAEFEVITPKNGHALFRRQK